MICGDSKPGWGKLKMSNLWPNAFVNKREPEAWNKHVVPYDESETTSSSTDTAHPFRLIPWLLELDSGMYPGNSGLIKWVTITLCTAFLFLQNLGMVWERLAFILLYVLDKIYQRSNLPMLIFVGKFYYYHYFNIHSHCSFQSYYFFIVHNWYVAWF